MAAKRTKPKPPAKLWMLWSDKESIARSGRTGEAIGWVHDGDDRIVFLTLREAEDAAKRYGEDHEIPCRPVQVKGDANAH